MPSRRRSRSKNLGTNLADVQRRMRYLERRPNRTKLQNKVVTTASIAVNAVTPDEVNFGTTILTSDPVGNIENPKDGLFVVNETAGTTSVYSQEQNTFIPLPAVDDTARTTADGKNTIYYDTSQPTGGTYAVDDTWFDTDDGYKMYTWNGSSWVGFQLGNSAIASITATKITAGSLASGVIVTSNLSAGQITTGTLTGITIQTSDVGTGRAIKIANSDDILFYTANDEIGILTVVNTNYSDTDPDSSWSFSDAVVMAGLEGEVPAQGTAPYPFVASSGSGTFGLVGLFGSSANYASADSFEVYLGGEVRTGGPRFSSIADSIELNSGWGDTDGTEWRVEINGPLILGEDNQGPLLSGTGTPSATYGFASGQIIFRYT